jgi:hypothetical protein
MVTPEKALTLENVYKVLSPEPLIDDAEFTAFYRSDLNGVRGIDKVAQIALGLTRAHNSSSYYRAFLMGHQGVGKSTELTRLVRTVGETYRAIRFSATMDLDAGGFAPFDVLLVMMIRLVEETNSHTGRQPSSRLLGDIERWFGTEVESRTTIGHSEAEASGGAGIKDGSPLGVILGLFASLKGEIKYTSDRKKEVTDHRLRRISSLVDLLNALLLECNQMLREYDGREWLFIAEDFDRSGIAVDRIESLFLNYSNLFTDIRSHLIFTIPISLVYSERAPQLAYSGDKIHSIPDTPVFYQDHTPHEAGREAVRKVLSARLDTGVFADGQLDRLIVASGGNLRDLFRLISSASDSAILRDSDATQIEAQDANGAIGALRGEYERRLGESPYDEQKAIPVTYDMKVERLKLVYEGNPIAKIPAPALYSLLRARAVQEFNGERWFGVHPLVVDILAVQGKLNKSPEGNVPGGTL